MFFFFQVRTRDDLALMYNDMSVLENMHASTLFKILRDEKYNILANMSDSQRIKARKTIIKAILHTDMSHHCEIVSQIGMFYEMHEQQLICMELDPNLPSCFVTEASNKVHLVSLILHAADVSNPAKVFDVYEQVNCSLKLTCSLSLGNIFFLLMQHAKLVLEEFFEQGDKEKELGLPVSPMFDRDTTSLPKSQVGFIEFIVGPLYSAMLKVFPAMKECGENLVQNRRIFADRWLQEIEDEEVRKKETEANDKRQAAFVAKFHSATRARHLTAKSRKAARRSLLARNPSTSKIVPAQ